MLIGKPGLFATLPFPTGEVKAPFSLGESEHDLLAGGVAVDYAPGVPKTRWSFKWEGLGADDAGVLYAYATRQRGRGPWTMYLPETRHNVLTPDQASFGDASSAVAGWVAAGTGETLAVSSAQSRLPGGVSTLWSLPAAVAGGILLAQTPYPDLYGWPAAPGQVWSFGCYVYRGAGDTTFDTRAGIRWLDAAGATLSTSTGTYTATAAAWAQRAAAAAVAPASTAYALPLLQVDATDVSSTASLYVDDGHLEMASSIVSHLPGGGLSRVSIVAPTRDFPVAEWSSVSLVFQEV